MSSLAPGSQAPGSQTPGILLPGSVGGGEEHEEEKAAERVGERVGEEDEEDEEDSEGDSEEGGNWDFDITLRASLANPGGDFDVGDQIRLLKGCIGKGKRQSKELMGRDLVIFLGNTGAGKSTTANYLAGFPMKTIHARYLNIPGVVGGKKVVVDEEKCKELGLPGGVAKIGHTTRSETFIPQLIMAPSVKLDFLDCPGFLDDRGAAVNIANAVNIKTALKNAKSVKVICLVGYNSLLGDRSRGAKYFWKMAKDLFGI